MENSKKIFDLAKKELLTYTSSIAINDINDIMEKYDEYDVSIGYYGNDGLEIDYSLNDNSDTAKGNMPMASTILMDFDGMDLVDEVIDYYNNLERNMTACIIISYNDEDGDYIEYYLEYNGYELYSDERQ